MDNDQLPDTWQSTVIWQRLSARSTVAATAIGVIQTWMPQIEQVLRQGGTQPSDFTLHDERHGYRVAQRMAELMTLEDMGDLSDYEMAILLLSAYLHDIGMVPERTKLDAHVDYLQSGNPGNLTEDQCAQFRSWLDDDERGISIPIGEGSLVRELIASYTRSQHNDWSREWIESNSEGIPELYPDWLADLILVCQSHNWDKDRLIQPEFDGVVRGDGPRPVHLRYLACVLRVADVMENDPGRTPAVLLRHRGVIPKSQPFWLKDHYLSTTVTIPSVVLSGRPISAVLHKALLQTAGDINGELALCAWLWAYSDLNHCHGHDGPLARCWRLEQSAREDIHEADGSDYLFINGSFRPRTDRLLELIGSEHLYGSPFAAVREMIQNAFDAVREKIAYLRLKTDRPANRIHETALGDNERVCLRLYEKDGRWWLECHDTGVGMTKNIIASALLRNAQGGRGEIRTLQRLCREAHFELGRTGQFGIGVLSYFMLADQVTIVTRRSEVAPGGAHSETLEFTVDGLGDFGELKRRPSETLADSGTIVRFRLRPDRTGENAKRFCRQLRDRINEYVGRTPCRLEIDLPSEFCGDPVPTFTTGWLRGDADVSRMVNDAWTKSEPGDWLSFDQRLSQADEQRARSDSLAKLSWAKRESLCLGGKALLRVWLPLFQAPDGLTLAGFFHEGEHRVTPISGKVGCYLATPAIFLGSWKGVNCTLTARTEFPSVELYPGQSVFSLREDFMHPFVIELDLLDSPSAVLSADRASVALPQEFAVQLSDCFRHECLSLLNQWPALFEDRNPYADFNRWRVGRRCEARTTARWFLQRGREVHFEKWSFPFTVQYGFSAYSGNKSFDYCGAHVSVLGSPTEVVGSKAYGEFPGGGGLEIREPDRICFYQTEPAYVGQEIEVGVWPLWLKSTTWIGCKFPEQWQSLAGARLGYRRMIWNRQNPLVNLAGHQALVEEGQSWPSNNKRWRMDEPEYIRWVLSSPAAAAQALLLRGVDQAPRESPEFRAMWSDAWKICAQELHTPESDLRFYIGEQDSLETHSPTSTQKRPSLKLPQWPAMLGIPTDPSEALVIKPG